MASVAFIQEVETHASAINEIVSSTMPAIPIDLPDDEEAAIPILNGLLIGEVNPDSALLSDAVYRLQSTQKDWRTHIDKIKDAGLADAAGREFSQAMTAHDVVNCLRLGRVRHRALNLLKILRSGFTLFACS